MGKRAAGDGSIIKATDGRWRGRIRERGKEHWVSGKTKAEVAAALRRKAHELRSGAAAPDVRLTVGAYLAGWLDTCRPQVRPHTHRVYSQHVTIHMAPALGGLRLLDLAPHHVAAFLARLVAEGRSPTTARNIRATLRRALADAVRVGTLARNAAALAQAPRLQPPPPAWLDAAQAERFLAAALGSESGDCLALILLLGLRRGEALGLRWEDLDGGRLSIRRTLQDGAEFPTKSRASTRTLPLPPEALEIMERQRDRTTGTGYVWPRPDGRPRSDSWLNKPLRLLLEGAGLPRVRLHDLRHSTASILLERGIPARVVADLLGHSHVGLTLGTYSHVTTRLVGGATAEMGTLARPKGAGKGAGATAANTPDGPET